MGNPTPVDATDPAGPRRPDGWSRAPHTDRHAPNEASQLQVADTSGAAWLVDRRSCGIVVGRGMVARHGVVGQRVDLDVGVANSLFDMFTDLATHTRQDCVAHLKDQNARFAPKRASFEGVAQQIRHLRRKFHTTSAGTDYSESQSTLGILGRQIRRNVVERVDHSVPERVCVSNLAEGN